MQVFSPILVMNRGAVRMLSDVSPASFDEGVRATRVRVSAPRGESDVQAMASAWLTCRRGGPVHDGVACLGCGRFVDCLLAHRSADIRCRWRGTDAVEEIMTDVAALICVEPQTSCEEAIELAWHNRVRNLVVADGQLGLGIVNDFDLLVGARQGSSVLDVLSTGVPSVAPEATLAQAVTVFKRTSVGVILVVERNRLLGLLTPSDLLSCGVQPQALGQRRCACCGTGTDVHTHPDMEWVHMCVDCLARSYAPTEYTELGVGD